MKIFISLALLAAIAALITRPAPVQYAPRIPVCRVDDGPMTPPCRLKLKGFKGVSPLHPVPDIRPLLT